MGCSSVWRSDKTVSRLERHRFSQKNERMIFFFWFFAFHSKKKQILSFIFMENLQRANLLLVLSDTRLLPVPNWPSYLYVYFCDALWLKLCMLGHKKVSNICLVISCHLSACFHAVTKSKPSPELGPMGHTYYYREFRDNMVSISTVSGLTRFFSEENCMDSSNYQRDMM